MKRTLVRLLSDAVQQPKLDTLIGNSGGAFSITTHFNVPEFDMGYDLHTLSQSSGFLVKAKDPNFGRKYHFVTVSHTVAPWRWQKKYYPQQTWLQHVNESHCWHSIQLRYDDGIVLHTAPLWCRSYHHKTLDLAVLQLMNEDLEFRQIYDKFGIKVDDLLPSNVPLKLGQLLEFHGHDVRLPHGDELAESGPEPNVPGVNGGDNRRPYPFRTSGTFFMPNGTQNFAATDAPLMDGMCGGSVIARRSTLPPQDLALIDASVPAQRKNAAEKYLPKTMQDTSFIVGMTEGIVPQNHPDPNIRGSGAFISAEEIHRFIPLVEQMPDQDTEDMFVLQGGETLMNHMSSNPNPKTFAETFAPYLDPPDMKPGSAGKFL